MPLVECTDCHNQISDAAPACPHCGRPGASAQTRPAATGAPVTRQLSAKLAFGIVFIPFVFAWYTLGKGYSRSARIASFSWLSLNVWLIICDKVAPDSVALQGMIGFSLIISGIVALLVGLARRFIPATREHNVTPPSKILATKTNIPAPKQTPPAEPALSKKVIKPAPATTVFSKKGIKPTANNLSFYSRSELLEVAFSYIDADSNFTQREISVSQVTGTYVKGWCHERKAVRTFRLDSILQDVTLLSTGEVISVNDWARAVRKNG